jgi:hypothetical protein
MLILLAPIFIKPLNRLIGNQSLIFKNKTALSNVINFIESSDSLYIDCPKAIRAFCKHKGLIDSINLDSLSLKDQIKDSVKLNDLNIIQGILDECSKYNYTDISTEDNIKLQKKTIKILTKINSYV